MAKKGLRVRRPAVRWLRRVLLILLGLLLLALLWLGFASNAKITAVRNTLHYQVVERLGGPRLRSAEPPGAVAGIVQDEDGVPVAAATVLLASPVGDTYSAETGADGRYQIADMPPGRYVPVAAKRSYVDALPQTCIAGMCWKDAVVVRPASKPGGEAQGVNLELNPAEPLEIVVDDSLLISPTMGVETTAPLPGRALRTNFSFERAGLRVNDCWLYEPLDAEGSLPTLLLVLPGPVLGWEIIPVPFAAQGFSVLACYPLRGIAIDDDAADLLTALEYVRQGFVPSHADLQRLGLIAASFTSLHGYSLLGVTDEMDVALVLGGISDAFAFRREVVMGTAVAREPFDQVLVALGYPHSSPETYFKHSVIYHWEGMPPLCLLHGRDDELVPFSQSVIWDEELTRRGLPHEFYAYDGLKHYFSTSSDNATTQQMFQDSLDCLRRSLPPE